LPPGASPDQIPAMLQTLLAERFHLEIRHENRQLSALALTVARAGPKLKPAETGEQWSGGAMKGGILPGRLELHQLNMLGLAATLAGRVHRPVVDRTNLTGLYDVS